MRFFFQFLCSAQPFGLISWEKLANEPCHYNIFIITSRTSSEILTMEFFHCEKHTIGTHISHRIIGEEEWGKWANSLISFPFQLNFVSFHFCRWIGKRWKIGSNGEEEFEIFKIVYIFVLFFHHFSSENWDFKIGIQMSDFDDEIQCKQAPHWI